MHSTLLYKLKIVFILQFEDLKFPPESAKNGLTKNDLFFPFWGLALKHSIYSQEIAKNEVQKTSLLCKNYLPAPVFLFLFQFSSSLLTYLLYFSSISLSHKISKYLSACGSLSLSLFSIYCYLSNIFCSLSFLLSFFLFFFLSFSLSLSLSPSL